MGNKVKFGLKNVHYAPFTIDDQTGEISYDTPKRIPGAVELSLEPRGDMAEFYADDMIYYSAQNNQGYDGTLSIALIPEQFAIDCLGEEKDDNDHVLTEKTTNKGKPFALLFEFDGDAKGTRHVLYNCTASRPTVSSSTRTDTVEPTPDELTFVASPRPTDYIVKRKTTTETPDVVYNSWYDAVYDVAADTTPPTVLSVSPADESTDVAVDSDIVWTFSEAIQEDDVTGANFFVLDSSGDEVAGALTLSADKTTVTFSPTSSFAALSEYTAVATKNIRDLAGNKLEQNSVTNFTTA